MKILGGLLCLIAFIFGIAGLIFLYAAFDIVKDYSGIVMGQEAKGFTSFFAVIAIVFLLISIILGLIGWKIVNKAVKNE